MKFVCKSSGLVGSVGIPGSKSHTIRALFAAALADGTSRFEAALTSADTESAVGAIEALGGRVDCSSDYWEVTGFGGRIRPFSDCIDVGNSGTTLRILLGAASLIRDGELILTGDEQIQRRPAQPLISALNSLGANVASQRNNGCAPLVVRGTLAGGRAELEAPTSQYLTSLLMACPLAEHDTDLNVPLLNEKPYVQMTLDWLEFLGIQVEHENMQRFHIPGGQKYRPFNRRIPADFSSASFFLAAGALGANSVVSEGLDMNDSQGDKAVVDYLRDMGAGVEVMENQIRVSAGQLRGIEIDMNETPDALPVMSVVGCFAKGETRLINVAHARIKETDRIAVMCQELRKMGADIEERPDGLVIRESPLHGAEVNGHHDHRVVMALALAGLNCPGETRITTAEAANVTFPNFAELMRSLGGELRSEQ